jgi:type II secretory pathway pseudopilin PulG
VLELLVVIAILGILGALTLPVLKNFGKSDATLGASRQLLDDVGRARQLALSQRTTVYMVFVPPNFWTNGSGVLNTAWFNSLTPVQQTAATNLAGKQLTGYTFIARGAVGDQPGQHAWHYLAPWQALPDGTFIALTKFTNTPAGPPCTITDGIDPINKRFDVYGFNFSTSFPFPAETNGASGVRLPYLAFNYLGELTVDGQTLAPRDEYIPLAHGSVLAIQDANTKAYLLPSPPPNNSPEGAELPPGNSTNSAYNIVHIDRLSGRAILEFQKLQ